MRRQRQRFQDYTRLARETLANRNAGTQRRPGRLEAKTGFRYRDLECENGRTGTIGCDFAHNLKNAVVSGGSIIISCCWGINYNYRYQ
jgi:hypothetical protein